MAPHQLHLRCGNAKPATNEEEKKNPNCPQGRTVEVISTGFFFCLAVAETQSLVRSAYSEALTPLSALHVQAPGRREGVTGETGVTRVE